MALRRDQQKAADGGFTDPFDDPFNLATGGTTPAPSADTGGGAIGGGTQVPQYTVNDGAVSGSRSQGSETPVDRMVKGEVGGNQYAPPTPSYPSPQAGAMSMGTSGSTDAAGGPGAAGGGMSTFAPLAGVSPAGLTSTRRSLYGKAGGLLGGGLGVSSQGSASDPITALLKKLSGGQ